MEDFNAPSPQKQIPVQQPKLEPFKSLIDKWIETDRKVKRNQRHTAKRVYDRLCEEAPGFNCSYRLVAQYVTEKKKLVFGIKQSGNLPLEHHPGEAQGDFGAADFLENSTRRSGKYFVLCFPHSNKGYGQLHYGENMECLLESLQAIFEHIGGVPTEIWFDNTSTIVTEIIKGGGRTITERFMRFQEHYGFRSIFMNPESGWEKGAVENKVGYSRRNMFVPMPEFMDLAEYNRQLLKKFDEDADREHYRFNETIEERFSQDIQALKPLPSIPFDTSRIESIHTNHWGKFILNGKHEYSVSPKYADSTVYIRLTSATVTVLDEHMEQIVCHRRLYGDEKQQAMDWLPYLSYIAKKPRSLKNSGIYEMMPVNMQCYLDSVKSDERGKILRALAELTDRTGFSSAVATVDQAISHQANDADSLKNLYRRLYSDIPELPPMRQDSIPVLPEMPVKLSSYDAALRKAVS